MVDEPRGARCVYTLTCVYARVFRQKEEPNRRVDGAWWMAWMVDGRRGLRLHLYPRPTVSLQSIQSSYTLCEYT